MLHTNNLKVFIQKTPVLEDLSFNIDQGTFTGIIGPNGSGKTSLLRAISGVLSYTGELQLAEQEISTWSRSKRARYLSVVQQNPSIQFDFTVLDFILLGRLPHKGWLERTTSEDQKHAQEIIESLQLGAFKNRLITSLSGGERQRVLLAQSLIQGPSLLLLDEPTTHLDIYHQLDFMKHLESLTKRGTTVLAVFHDLSLANQYTDHLLVLNQGEQIAFGKTRDVLTPELIEDVFKINVQLHTDDQNHTYIHYQHTT